MTNFWDFNAWGGFNVIAVLLVSLLAASLLFYAWGEPKNLLLPILLIALGCANILYPKVFWIPRYGMDFRYVELSDRTKLLQNLAGVAVIVLGIVLWIV